MPMMAREVTYIKQDKPEGENLPAFLRYNKSFDVYWQKDDSKNVSVPKNQSTVIYSHTFAQAQILNFAARISARLPVKSAVNIQVSFNGALERAYDIGNCVDYEIDVLHTVSILKSIPANTTVKIVAYTYGSPADSTPIGITAYGNY